MITRRRFLKRSMIMTGGAAAVLGSALEDTATHAAAAPPGSKMRFGLVTYQWGKDWDLPTLLRNCETSGVVGVELRTTHAHGVEPSMNAAQREEVKQRFADSPVVLVGLGSNERFDNPDPRILAQAVERTKAFLELSQAVGGSGVKVKPNDFHPGIPHEQTIEQIGNTLNTLGWFAADLGQQVRLEIHGREMQDHAIIKAIMDIADHPPVAVCWNSNAMGLKPPGLEQRFNLVKDRFGATTHVRELNTVAYPYQTLMNLFVSMDYAWWILLEASSTPEDRVAALAEQHAIWKRMVS